MARTDHFVSATELAELLAGDRPPVVLDVRIENGRDDGPAEYAAGHIPGAVYVDLPTQLQGRRSGYSGNRPVPEIDQLQADARSWGIRTGDPVVVYDNVAGTKAGRAYWVLRWAGIADVRLLDGGYAAWVAAGLPVSVETPRPAPGDVVLRPGSLPVLDADGAAEYAAAGALYDARGPAQFDAGHVPGAVSAPTRDNLDPSGLLRDEDSLRKRFAELGIDGSRPIGLYCGGGVAAAHQAAVLHSLGIETALFVGSFSAWSSDPARPVERGR